MYRIKNAIRANYKINANGWNSGYDRYEPKKTKGKYRIAVVGDSYVEAFQVDYNKRAPLKTLPISSLM